MKNLLKGKAKSFYLILLLLLLVGGVSIKYIIHVNSDVNAGEEFPITQKEIKNSIEETDDVLLNPGKGFVLDSYTSKSYDDIYAIGYTRFDWCDIEPEEGVYNWSIIDNLINRAKSKGKKFAFGVVNASTTHQGQYVTPKWVFDAGAEGRTINVTNWYNNSTQTQTIPVWTDPIFLEKLNNFIVELGKRYDNNSSIAFIDIRSYGNWGEQHLGEIGGTDLTAEQLKDLYIQPYINNFKNTLLVNPFGKEMYNGTYEWAVNQGVSIRRDGIFKYSDGSECLIAYGKLPTIYEYTANYDWLKSNFYWSKNKLLDYIETGKPSYIQFDEKMYEENTEFCNMIANKVGYYFKLKESQYTNAVTRKENNHIKLKFKNEGVAPLYEKCSVYIGLLDQNDNLVKRYKTNINPKTWQPGVEIEENLDLEFSEVNNGKYSLAVGLYLNDDDQNPTYLLGNVGKTENKWYKFGNIVICEENQIIRSNNQENNNTENENTVNNTTDNSNSGGVNQEETSENNNNTNNSNSFTNRLIRFYKAIFNYYNVVKRGFTF